MWAYSKHASRLTISSIAFNLVFPGLGEEQIRLLHAKLYVMGENGLESNFGETVKT